MRTHARLPFVYVIDDRIAELDSVSATFGNATLGLKSKRICRIKRRCDHQRSHGKAIHYNPPLLKRRESNKRMVTRKPLDLPPEIAHGFVKAMKVERLAL